MALLDILTAPHPVLAASAREVRPDELGPELARRLDDMAETMYAAPGVGLAAPQVGDGRRVVVIDSATGEAEGGHGLLRLINPRIVARSAETIPWTETCLSVPDLEVTVERARHITLAWIDLSGAPQQVELHDFEAVIAQHELDHLLGTVLLDRVSAFRRRRWVKQHKRAIAAK